jgi:NAD(P)-dependent dehydrogenase (short-subunit alcohol dehydrogenase family)
MSRLNGKIAVVTSVGKVPGGTIAKFLAAEGADVALMDSDLGTPMDQVASDIRKMGRQALRLTGNLAVQAQAQKLFKEVCLHLGDPEILVNVGAGTLGTPVTAQEVTENDWNRVIGSNLTATFCSSQAVLSAMERVGHGSIINLAFATGIGGGSSGGPQHVAVKAGVCGLTRHLARELGPKDIRVNALVIGVPQRTEEMISWTTPDKKERHRILQQIPLRRLSSPKEYAQVVVFLASDDSSYITGAEINVTGGMFTV